VSLRAIGRWVQREFRAARLPFLFFLAGFLLVLLIIKLSLAQYSIEMTTIGRALLGAVVAAKVVLIFDETPVGRLFATMPRIVAVIHKTLIYGLGVIALGYAERIIDAWRSIGSFGPAFDFVTQRMGIHRLMATALGISLVFGAYFTLSEISDYIGKDALRDLFLKRPAARHAPPGGPSQPL
jgi:hypothetical protein